MRKKRKEGGADLAAQASAEIRALWIVLAVSMALIPSACSNPAPDKATAPLVIATLKGPSSMGMIRMIDSLNSSDGHTIEVEILNEPLQVRKMMIEKTADFVILPTTMAALLYNKGLEYRLLAIPVWGSLYLFGKDSSITQWDELRGRRVNAMARGMTPDVLFRYLLQKNDIDPEADLTLDYSFPTHLDLANAVAAGQTELAVISEPMASMVEAKNKHVYRLFNLSDEWSKYQGIPLAETAFMAGESTINTNSREIEKLLASYAHSTRWVNMHPDSAAMLIVKYGISPSFELALNSIRQSKFKFVPARDIRPEIDQYLEVFYQMNPDIVGGRIPDEDFIY